MHGQKNIKKFMEPLVPYELTTCICTRSATKGALTPPPHSSP